MELGFAAVVETQNDWTTRVLLKKGVPLWFAQVQGIGALPYLLGSAFQPGKRAIRSA
jgi:hypothetical protein